MQLLYFSYGLSLIMQFSWDPLLKDVTQINNNGLQASNMPMISTFKYLRIGNIFSAH